MLRNFICIINIISVLWTVGCAIYIPTKKKSFFRCVVRVKIPFSESKARDLRNLKYTLCFSNSKIKVNPFITESYSIQKVKTSTKKGTETTHTQCKCKYKSHEEILLFKNKLLFHRLEKCVAIYIYQQTKIKVKY